MTPVYLMTKKSMIPVMPRISVDRHVKIGSLNNDSVDINATGLSSVDSFNKQMLKYISETHDSSKQKFNDNVEIIESEDIVGIVFHIIRWRRCTGYIVIQLSDRGVRYLCYLVDAIYHKSEAFGTSYQSVQYSEVKKTFIEKYISIKVKDTFIEKYISIKMKDTFIKKYFSNIDLKKLEILKIYDRLPNSIDENTFARHFGI